MQLHRGDRRGRIEVACRATLCVSTLTLAVIAAACGESPHDGALIRVDSGAGPDARSTPRPDASPVSEEDALPQGEDDDSGPTNPDEDSGPQNPGDPDAGVHPDATQPTNACSGRIGLLCGARIGMAANSLYHCSDGDITLARTCTRGCIQHNDGPDTCACPDGDGAYCGRTDVGGDPHNLYNCSNGVLTLVRMCALSCHPEPPGTNDHCNGCPSGNGLYCGRPVGADPNTLYDCQDGALTVRQHCGGPCHENPPGVADSCNTCPQGNGLYCGAPIGMDANTLYRCTNGAVAVQQHCSRGCSVQPPGVDDFCTPDGSGSLNCNVVQWWNVALTYGPYRIQNGGETWWDTDLAVGAGTQVQLRHASRLVAAPVQPWGWQPQFVDTVTGQRFQFLHLRPQNRYTTAIGTTYPAGTIVGLSGGNTGDTGYPQYSTGAHLCVETIAAWRTAFPAGRDPCH